ncbi:GGDEF domain-containing protein [Photobacterium kishitanii]|uniref:GGDEF domain-containing protein n=1 Tax=Photobacterium kishitanii TaxID=318456 RepID=A0A2T3KMX4_9GAMM|nr:GGDEF domain-containing protein [Photobacterium kishitanii]PSV01150.1 hypothetical protein C9J27_03765 [Photobacterium kishitanii]
MFNILKATLFSKKTKNTNINSFGGDLFDGSFDSIAILDHEFKVMRINEQMSYSFECVEDDVIGSYIWSFMASNNPKDDFLNMMLEVDSSGKLLVNSFPARKRDGSVFISNFKVLKSNSNGAYVFIIKDLTAFKERENVLIRDAKSDNLTGLLNRKGLEERLSYAIDELPEYSNFKIGVLFIDLDEFKSINDTFGHKAGDELLCYVARALRDSLPEESTISRIGGDEFVCVVPVCESKRELNSFGLSIIENVAKSVIVDGNHITVKCSVGGALFPDDAKTVESIIKSSDYAMYSAKTSGKNKVHILGL